MVYVVGLVVGTHGVYCDKESVVRTRNVRISGVMKAQCRLAKLLFDLERKKSDGSFLLSGAARKKVEELVYALRNEVR